MIGDNIILENEVAAPSDPVLDALIAGAIDRGKRVHFLAFDASPRALRQRIPSLKEASIIDCFSRGLGNTDVPSESPPACTVVTQPDVPEEVLHVIDGLVDADESAFLVIDSLNGMARLWGSEDLPALFYSRVCPRLFDAGNLALWVLHRGVQSEQFHAALGHIAQVVLCLERETQDLSVQIRRATGRPEAIVGVPIPCSMEGGQFRLEPSGRREH
ncbi:MAG: hypothetical protein ACPHID_08455 [Thermoplasmatota archaeon]